MTGLDAGWQTIQKMSWDLISNIRRPVWSKEESAWRRVQTIITIQISGMSEREVEKDGSMSWTTGPMGREIWSWTGGWWRVRKGEMRDNADRGRLEKPRPSRGTYGFWPLAKEPLLFSVESWISNIIASRPRQGPLQINQCRQGKALHVTSFWGASNTDGQNQMAEPEDKRGDYPTLASIGVASSGALCAVLGPTS